MKLNLNPLFAAVALAISISYPAHAGFEMIDDEPVSVQTAKAKAPAALPGRMTAATPSADGSLFGDDVNVSAPRVLHVGRVNLQDSVVKSGTADVASALKLLSPPGWKGFEKEHPDLSKTVTWSGGQDWVLALTEALSQTNLMAEVNWTSRKITVFTMPDKVFFPTQAKTAKVVAARDADLMVGSWEVRPGETMRVAISRWMTTAGWQMIWEVQNDFELKAGAVFTGKVEDAMQKVAESAGVNISMYKGNRVAVVREGSN